MNVWAKMITALRGGVNEAGEAIIDTQALRILDQELRDASEELRQSKDSLAAIIAREKLSAEKAERMAAKSKSMKVMQSRLWKSRTTRLRVKLPKKSHNWKPAKHRARRRCRLWRQRQRSAQRYPGCRARH